jgi:hypothetical protein
MLKKSRGFTLMRRAFPLIWGIRLRIRNLKLLKP